MVKQICEWYFHRAVFKNPHTCTPAHNTAAYAIHVHTQTIEGLQRLYHWSKIILMLNSCTCIIIVYTCMASPQAFAPSIADSFVRLPHICDSSVRFSLVVNHCQLLPELHVSCYHSCDHIRGQQAGTLENILEPLVSDHLS